MSWLVAHWERFQLRRRHFKEFRQTGVFDVRRQADAGILEAEKLNDARLWLRTEDTRYQRWAFRISAIALIISAISGLISYNNWQNARYADRAWVGPVLMRLSKKPAIGKPLRFFLEYQNTGRQPAQDVFYEPDSYAYSKEMAVVIAARTERNVEECKSRHPNRGQLTIFPGKQTFTPYQIKKSSNLITRAVTSGSDLVLISGCFVYRTLDEVHRTAFCFQHDASNPQEDDEGKPVMSFCLSGNYAD